MWLLIIGVIAFVVGRWLHQTQQKKRNAARKHAPEKRISTALRLKYRSRSGQVSQRTVHIYSFTPSTPVQFNGRCTLRDDFRTFRADRVLEAVDNQTGELVPDVGAWLEAQYAARPSVLAKMALTLHPHHLPLLLHVARADGSMRAAERAIIALEAVKLYAHIGINAQNADAVLDEMPTPAFPMFCHHCHEILRLHGPSEAARLLGVARALVNTQKTIHPNEQAALDYLQQQTPQGI
jgi:hypothetical protein